MYVNNYFFNEIRIYDELKKLIGNQKNNFCLSRGWARKDQKYKIKIILGVTCDSEKTVYKHSSLGDFITVKTNMVAQFSSDFETYGSYLYFKYYPIQNDLSCT